MELWSNRFRESIQQGFLHESTRRLGKTLLFVSFYKVLKKRHLEAALCMPNGLVVG
jgi:hypothetical protein